jgi:hypothetical protein
MSRRIVFAGGAQTRALARIYRGEIAARAGDDVVFIGTGAVGTDAARSTLLLADIVAMEIDEDGDAVPAADLPSRADVVRIPNLYCDYLWPFAGRAHPKNRGQFALPGGPYPAEHGDRFLDQMAADGVDEDVAIARYLAMDIVKDGELDSRLTDRMAIQQQLDAKAGYDLAGFVQDRFRQEPLFRTRQRLTMPLLRRLVTQVFGKLKVKDWDPASLRRVPFPAGAQPIHPGVIAYFGLTWVAADQEYPVNEEGFFSFEAFCRRYMQFAWNETLHRGIQTAKTNPAAALQDLEQGLAISPESRLGHLAFTVARREAGLDPSPADPNAIIDEESYDPAEEGAEIGDLPDTAAPAEPARTVEPEADLLAAAAPVHDDAATAVPDEAGALAEEGSAAADGAAQDSAPVAEDALEETPAADAAAPEPAPEAEAAPPSPPITRFPAPAKPALVPASIRKPPSPGSTDDGFTDFRPAPPPAPEAPTSTVGNELIEVLPRLLPVFTDLASAVDRPFGTMPEVMPPPPLRPILPPELQGDAPKPGLFARLLGKKHPV